MNTPRRAASRFVTAARLVTGALAFLLAAVLGALAALTTLLARRVVTPARRAADLDVIALDPLAQTITLSRTDDTVLPGRYGLFTNGDGGYLKLGAVLGEDERGVRRKLLTRVAQGSDIGRHAAFSGWYYDQPGQLHLPYTDEVIGTPVGGCPAWLFPAEGEDWVIVVHGRGAARAEALRAVPVLHESGTNVLVVSYRNDGEAPRSKNGTYGLGVTEWRDVDAAIAWARRRGASRIVLMGWSMGGAIALQTVLNTADRELLVGVLLDSPVIDWRSVLDYQARGIGVPPPLSRAAMDSLGAGWSARLAGAEQPIPFDALDMVARAAELDLPVLLLHSEDDGFVPAAPSHALAEARPDIVTMHTFQVARHTKLWNYDETRWNDAIRDWLGEVLSG